MTDQCFDSFVLAASTPSLADEPAARTHADCVEFRMDLASDGLAALASYDGELPLLVTNRVAGEGGEAPDTPERLDTLATALEQPAVAAIDVELRSARAGEATELLERADRHDVSVVVSAHEFESTPDRETMAETLRTAGEYGEVAKLAVTAEDREDVLSMLAVTHELDREGHRVATMAMGEVGRHSRALAPLYGSKIGYAPVDPANATAPGQYDLETLRGLIERLHGNGKRR